MPRFQNNRGVIALAMLAPLAMLAACSSRSASETTTGVTATDGSGSGAPETEISRPLHLPQVISGRCPTSRGRYISTPTISGIALGSGSVRIFINNAGDLRRGRAHLAASERDWLALKTHFFSSPSYQGAFLVRARRLDRSGPVTLGAAPGQAASFFAPAGPAANGLDGWREFPQSTFVKGPGCYGVQVDGENFSEVIVIQMLSPLDV
jgi:hypothetical protein